MFRLTFKKFIETKICKLLVNNRIWSSYRTPKFPKNGSMKKKNQATG